MIVHERVRGMFCIIKDINVKKEKNYVSKLRERKNCVQSKLCNFPLIKLHSDYDDDEIMLKVGKYEDLYKMFMYIGSSIVTYFQGSLQEERIPDNWQIIQDANENELLIMRSIQTSKDNIYAVKKESEKIYWWKWKWCNWRIRKLWSEI